MSSLLNSAAAVTWQDLIRYVAGHLSEAKKTMITKVLGKKKISFPYFAVSFEMNAS